MSKGTDGLLDDLKYPGTHAKICETIHHLKKVAVNKGGLYIKQAANDADNDLEILKKAFRIKHI